MNMHGMNIKNELHSVTLKMEAVASPETGHKLTIAHGVKSQDTILPTRQYFYCDMPC